MLLQNGYIRCKFHPELVLSVLEDCPVRTLLAHPVKGETSREVAGSLVGLDRKQGDDTPLPHQCWQFKADGRIYCNVSVGNSRPTVACTVM